MLVYSYPAVSMYSVISLLWAGALVVVFVAELQTHSEVRILGKKHKKWLILFYIGERNFSGHLWVCVELLWVHSSLFSELDFRRISLLIDWTLGHDLSEAYSMIKAELQVNQGALWDSPVFLLFVFRRMKVVFQQSAISHFLTFEWNTAVSPLLTHNDYFSQVIDVTLIDAQWWKSNLELGGLSLLSTDE